MIVATFVVAAVIGVLLGIVVALVLICLSYAGDLNKERNRVDDLHNRLAARTLAEYAQFSPSSGPRTEPEMPDWVFDETGLIGAEAGTDGEA